jgi:hypothetical protein
MWESPMTEDERIRQATLKALREYIEQLNRELKIELIFAAPRAGNRATEEKP